ncbi:MAG: hypothetical protein CMJ72_09990 [Planctomycetaceae bacterium]|nr:hypothetical protein [Planctomycetaceae bacterium]MCH2595579.1 hypothetical protein [Pirellulales bacterium]
MATIIKRESQMHSSGTSLRGVAYDLSNIESQAESYLGDVRGEAAKIIQQAKQEATKIRKQAEQAGRQTAEAAVEAILDKKVVQQMKTMTPALAKAVQQIEDSRLDWMRHWEKSAIQLATGIAAQIIRRELSQHPEIAIQWVQEALQLSAGAAEITVHLHPTDYETIGNQVEQLASVFCQAAPATIIADDSVSRGGCLVTTEFGSVDLQLETQLSRLAEEMC